MPPKTKKKTSGSTTTAKAASSRRAAKKTDAAHAKKSAAKKTQPASHAKKPSARKVTAAGAVDPSLKREYDRQVAIISKTTHGEMVDFDARWEAAGRIVFHEPPLYYAGGCTDAADFYLNVMHEEPRNAQRFVRVARFATPMEEEFFGITKLDAAIAFLEAKIGHKIEHPPIPVAFDLLRIPVGKGTKSLKDASVAEIHRATAALHSGGKKRPKNVVHAAIEQGLTKVSSLANVIVNEHGGLLTFQKVPIAALTHFLKVLTHANAKDRG